MDAVENEETERKRFFLSCESEHFVDVICGAEKRRAGVICVLECVSVRTSRAHAIACALFCAQAMCLCVGFVPAFGADYNVKVL